MLEQSLWTLFLLLIVISSVLVFYLVEGGVSAIRVYHSTWPLTGGHIVEQGPTDDIFAHPRHPYTLALLSANPEPDPEADIEDRIELKGEVPSLMNRPLGCEFHTRCPFAAAHCDTEFPPVQAFGEAHSLTCHYPREG